MSKVTVKCSYCGEEVKRERRKVKRSKKLNKKIFCSLSCSGKINYVNLPFPPLKRTRNNLSARSKLDEFSPYRRHLRKARERAKQKNKDINITIENLKEIWEKQKGICPYTGWKMFNPLSSTKNNRSSNKILHHLATLDCIDASKGYVKNNVQFISWISNIAKNIYDEYFLIKFCRDVSKKWKGKKIKEKKSK